MGQISREGTFRGLVLDNAFVESSGGYAQFQISLAALEYFDTEEQEWVDWSGQDEQTLAYLILFGKDVKKPLFHAKQIQKVFGWAGQDFKELNNPAWAQTHIQFRVEENEYNDNVTLQVSWIDEYDAVPGRVVQKADGATIKKLEAKYAIGLKLFGGTKVASAPATTGAPEIPVESNVAQTKPEKETVQDEPEIPAKATKPKTKKGTVTTSAGTCTKSEAWRYAIGLIEDNQPEMSNEERASLFTDAIQEVAPEAKTKAEVTSEQWYEIKELCGTKILKF